MKTLAVILIIVAVLGIVFSVFPTGFSGRSSGARNFTNLQNFTQNQSAAGFGFGGILNFVRIGMWIVVLIIAVLLLREPKKAKS